MLLKLDHCSPLVKSPLGFYVVVPSEAVRETALALDFKFLLQAQVLLFVLHKVLNFLA
jgi:hypothetical protein